MGRQRARASPRISGPAFIGDAVGLQPLIRRRASSSSPEGSFIRNATAFRPPSQVAS